MGHPFVMNPFVKPAQSKKTAVYRAISQTRRKIYLIRGVNASDQVLCEHLPTHLVPCDMLTTFAISGYSLISTGKKVVFPGFIHSLGQANQK